MYQHFFKGVIDRVIALVALCVSLPVLVPVTLILAVALRGNPFFVQQRPGLKGEPFYLVKFKTMTDARDEHGELLPDDERLVPIGRWIRSLSLDELPQFINVLKGEMSLIGPRPLLMEYLDIYTAEEQRRHNVLPGITGWAQVNGRNSISWKEKFALDVWYVEHLSFGLDIKIVFLSVLKVLKKEGVNASETVTMEKYNGNN
ncbi:sugar transferase [Paraneptunicella aestuarii]|uniref:sugar transferase n=1 Tax=Paraneptunicella aestuarii TaxID=2831148 RepID=UPI001E4FD75D|nr:sugar transferase [Paraneptunicella aestuarii]UAA39640.1 sugar transferase [Paraneptunicella aestuarii]